LVIAAEGLKNAHGETVAPPILTHGRDVYFGHISAFLSELIIRELGVKARGEKPGILGRASVALQSDADRNDAIEAGSYAVQALMDGETGVMAGCKRTGDAYSPVLVPLEVAGVGERKLPMQYISADGKGVTKDFLTYVTPLIGKPLPEYRCYAIKGS